MDYQQQEQQREQTLNKDKVLFEQLRERRINQLGDAIHRGTPMPPRKEFQPGSLEEIIEQGRMLREQSMNTHLATTYGNEYHEQAFSRAINSIANGSGSHRGVYGY